MATTGSGPTGTTWLPIGLGKQRHCGIWRVRCKLGLIEWSIEQVVAWRSLGGITRTGAMRVIEWRGVGHSGQMLLL